MRKAFLNLFLTTVLFFSTTFISAQSGCIDVHLENTDYIGFLWQRHLGTPGTTGLYEMNWQNGNQVISLIFLVDSTLTNSYNYRYKNGMIGVPPGTYYVYSGLQWSDHKHYVLGYAREYVYNPYIGYEETNELYSAVKEGYNEYTITKGTITISESDNGPYIVIEGYDEFVGQNICSTIGSLDNKTIKIPLTTDLVWQDNTSVAGWQSVTASGSGIGNDNLPYDATISIKTTHTTGTFRYSDLDLSNTILMQGNTLIPFTDATIVVTSPGEDVYEIQGTFIGSNGRTYIVTATYSDCPIQESGEAIVNTFKWDRDFISSELTKDETYEQEWASTINNKFITVIAYNTNAYDTHNYIQLYFWVGSDWGPYTHTYADGVIGPKPGTYNIEIPQMISEQVGYWDTYYRWKINDSKLNNGPVVVGNAAEWVDYFTHWRCPWSSYGAYRDPRYGVDPSGSVTDLGSSTIKVYEGKNGQMYIVVLTNGKIAYAIGEPAPQIGYKLTTTTIGKGTLTKTPDECWYMEGDQVTLTPTPASGWYFDGWNSECETNIRDNGNGTFTYTVPTKSCSVTAKFTETKTRLDEVKLCSSEIGKYTWRGKYTITDPSSQNGIKDTIWTLGKPDSVITLKLVIYQAYPNYIVTTETISMEQADTFTWEGENFKQYTHIEDTVKLDLKKQLQTINGCDSMVNLKLTIYPIKQIVPPGVKDSVEYDSICSTDYTYTWHEKTISISGKTDIVEYDTLRKDGQDSIIFTLRLHIFQVTQSTQSIEGTYPSFVWTDPWGDSHTWTSPLQDTTIYHEVAGSYGKCQHSLNLHITYKQVVPECVGVKATFSIDTICANHSEAYATLTITEGKATSYSIHFQKLDPNGHFNDINNIALNANGVQHLTIPFAPLADSTKYIRPDNYVVELSLWDTCGNIQQLTANMHVQYPAWVIVQRWDDVLALYNSRYNGGYEFDNIRWYHNGELITANGEHNSYLYSGPSNKLDFGHPYWAGLVRHGEEEEICTCHFLPKQTMNENTQFAERPIQIASRNHGHSLTINTELSGQYRIYDVCGKIIQTGYFGSTYQVWHIDINANMSSSGTYVIDFISEDGIHDIQKIFIQ